MIKITGNDVTVEKPAKPDLTGLNEGYFRTSGNSTTATKIPPWWMNMMQDEILSILAACGITPNGTTDSQLGACFNTKANKAGDTFTGPMNFNDSATFNGPAVFDKDDEKNVKFDEEIEFVRTVSAAACQPINTAFYNLTQGIPVGQATDEIYVPIEGINNGKLSEVRLYFYKLSGGDPVKLDLEVIERTMLMTSDAIFTSTELATSSEFTITDTGGINHTFYSAGLDCSDAEMCQLGLSTGAASYFAAIKVNNNNTGNVATFLGAKITYKRDRLAV